MKNVKSYAVSLLVFSLLCSSPAMALVISDMNKTNYTVQSNALAAGQLVYVDRTAITFSNVASLGGSTYIKTANDDKTSSGTNTSFLTFTINQDSTVYVAHDTRIATKPAWLSSFTDTAVNLVTSDTTLRLYSKTFPEGPVALGGNGGTSSHSMYSVVLVPIPVTAPPGAASNPSPVNLATGVSYKPTLSWTAGTEATSHILYFGASNPPAQIGSQLGTSYVPGELENDKTYYWRVDAVNSLGTTAGAVWSFTTSVTNAIGHWKMDDNAANSTVLDSVGSLNGTFVDPTNATTAYHHRADSVEGTGSLYFDGVNDYVILPRNSVIERGDASTRQLTVSAWIKSDFAGVPTNYTSIIGTGDGGWYLGSFPNENKLVFACWLVDGANGQTAVVTDDTPVFDGQWHHVVGVYDGSQIHLYVDGNHGQGSTIGGTIRNISNKAVLMGENAGAAGRYWKGQIDDVNIYDYAVSSEDIYHYHNPGYAWKPSPADGGYIDAEDNVLSWMPGIDALSHDVYFSNSQLTVSNARRLAGDINGDGPVDGLDLLIMAEQWLTAPGSANPSADIVFSGKVDIEDFAALASDWGQEPDAAFMGNQAGTVFNPEGLKADTTYYWRVDEVNPLDPDSPLQGRIWSFTTKSHGTAEIVFPGATWQTKTPAELGLDPAKIDLFAANIGGVGCIIRQGYLVKTWGAANSKDFWASASKPVTSTMLMYAVQEGLLSSVHEKIKDHGYAMNSKDQTMEFYHLANMTGGYTRGEVPGAAWAYNDYGIKLYMNTLFGNVYGTSANAATLNANRLGVLGFEDGDIFQTRIISGTNYGEHLNTSPRDFARIGWFWLNKGWWGDRQRLPKRYFDDYMKALVPAGTPRTSSSTSDYLGIGTYGGPSDQTAYGPGIYGFNWWFNPNQSHWPDVPADAFQANGHWGQEVLTVIPSHSLVVAWRRGPVDSTWFQPGNASSPMNQNLKLLVEACPPVQTMQPGSLIVDPDNPAWLTRYSGKPLFLCGPGDPEDFLYRGTRNADGTRNGDQMALINKLKGTGANSIYFQAVKSHGGDGDSLMNPFVDGNVNGLLDEDILNQWETWFTEMDNNGIVIFFMFYDDNANPFGSDLINGELPAKEAYMIDTIVTRFKHHRNLIWIVSEEYQKALTTARVSKIAERIKANDNFNHPVGVHQLPGTSFNFNNDANMDQFAMQLNDATTSYIHSSCVAAWNNVGGMKNVNLAEIYEFNEIPQTGAALRQKAWAAAMGGAYSMWLWMDIANTPISDLQICGRVVSFFESTRFNWTQPYDSLARGDTKYVLARPGFVYIAYSDSGTSYGINVLAGTYRVKWFDVINGTWVDQGNQTLAAGDRYFTKPGGFGAEAALYLEAPLTPMDIVPNDDCTTLDGVNRNNYAPEMGLFVKYEGTYSWIEFTLGYIPVNQATLTLYQDDGLVQSPWEIVVRGAEFDFDETTFTGTDFSSWERIGMIPNVAAIAPVYLDLTEFYNENLGKTVTLHLYRDQQPVGNINGPIFQDKELTRKFWWSAKSGPKISIQ